MNFSRLLSSGLLTVFGTLCAAQELHLEAKLQAPAEITYATTCGNGTQLLGVTKDGDLYRWATLSGPAQRILSNQKITRRRITNFACSRDGKWIAAGVGGKEVLVIDSATLEPTQSFQVSNHDLGSISFSPDGSLLAVTANDSATQLWDVRTGQRLATGKTILGASTAAAFSPDGKRFLSADEDTVIRAYTVSGEPLYSSEADLLEPFGVAFTPDGKQFVVAGAGGTVSLFDATNGHKIKTSASRGNPIFNMTMVPDGRRVCALEFDDFKFEPVALSLWDLNSNEWKKVDVDPKTILGAGTAKDHLLIIRSEGSQALSLWSLQ